VIERSLSLVGQSSVPAPLPDAEIESLREGLKLRNIAPHPYLVVGARVCIHKGVLPADNGISPARFGPGVMCGEAVQVVSRDQGPFPPPHQRIPTAPLCASAASRTM
jgi:hypothetical protein